MQSLSQSPTDPGFVQNPYPFYARARAAGDFIFWEDYGLICATSHRAARAVLRDRGMAREPPPGKGPQIAAHTESFYAVEAHSMLELEPPRHTRLRGLVLRAFTSRRIRELAPDITALSQDLARDLPKGPVDLIPAFAARLPVIVIARLLGVPDTMADQLLNWSHAMVGMYQARRTRVMEDAANRAALEFADFLRGYVREKRQRPADDLITHLIAAEEDGEKLSTDELITTCILLLNAGHEATVHSLGNGIKALLETGAGRDCLSPDHVPGTVEEILRFDPPLHIFTRWVYEPLRLFGQPLDEGREIAVLLGSAGRDKALGPNPDKFDPTRDPAQHIAFGAGLHFCVGAPLARLEMQIALPVLFAAHPNLSLAGSPQYADVYHFHGLDRLLVSTI